MMSDRDCTAIDPAWHVFDEYTGAEAAALSAGVDPEFIERAYYSPMDFQACVPGTLAERANSELFLLGCAIEKRTIPADVERDLNGNLVYTQTKITREAIIDWLKSRGMTTGFFFPEANGTPATAPASTPDYLNPDHPHYTPKLAAAVKAWQALAGIEVQGKSVKQALERWLRDNAHTLKLMKDDGSPNYTALDEIAKVANWNPKGGASRTPTHAPPKTPA